ncbi:MAG: hypothetical protein ACREB9_02690 [Thermoplasmata archaeon]
MTSASVLSPNIIYPELHGSLGFGFFLAFYFFLPASWFFWALLLAEAVLLNKETWFDPLVEGPTQPFWPEGVKDFLAYQAGFLVAVVLLVLTRRPL